MHKSPLFTSALLKLTLSYLAIIAIICLIFSTAIYHFATSELHDGLFHQSQRIANEFPGFNFNPALRTQRYLSEGTHRILLNLLYVNFSVLVAAGFASYGLARWTLRPIEASHNQQKRFTADVSHELRTPLTALKMTSEVALLDPSANKGSLRTALQSNLDDAARLEALINNLLRLTRLEFSELQQQFEAVPVSTIVDAAVKSVADNAKVRKITFNSSVDDSLLLQGDQDSLTQLLTIFLDNAVKYSPNGAAIDISAVSDTPNIALTVRDHGIGIDAAALPHIFERFYRADAARLTENEENGFGLGLSIAKMIAELHNGHIRMTSASGHGTTVTAILPAAKA